MNDKRKSADSEKKKRLKRFQKFKKLEQELEKIWRVLKEKSFKKEILWYMVQNIDWKPLEKKAWEELKNIGLDENDDEQLYDCLEKRTVEPIAEEIKEKFLELAFPDTLFCAMKFRQPFLLKKQECLEELMKRAKSGSISRLRAKRILIQSIRDIPDLTKAAFQKLKSLNPSSEELLNTIAALEHISSLPNKKKQTKEMLVGANRLLREKQKSRSKNFRVARKIHDLVEKIKELE